MTLQMSNSRLTEFHRPTAYLSIRFFLHAVKNSLNSSPNFYIYNSLMILFGKSLQFETP